MTEDPFIAQARVSLSALQSLTNPLEVQLRAAAVITRVLERYGDHAVVVGGSAVSFYTGGAYLSRDVDLITTVSGNQLVEVLAALGFERRDGAWVHAETDVIVDFPAPPLAGDPERITRVQTDDGPVAVIGIEDLLVDRLNAVVHWKDTESREWCISMLALHKDLEMEYLRRQAESAGVGDELQAVTREAASQ